MVMAVAVSFSVDMGIFPGAKSNSAGDHPVAKVTALTTALKRGALAEPTGRYSAILKE